MHPERLLEISVTGICEPHEARQLATLALVGRARRRDPSTSREAVASMTPQRQTARRLAVLACMELMGRAGTDEEIAAWYLARREHHGWPSQSPSGLRTRRAELVALGMVMHDGHARNSHGNRARRWRAGPATV
jgi:hypothetical protein